jgi:hypothetical protein
MLARSKTLLQNLIKERDPAARIELIEAELLLCYVRGQTHGIRWPQAVSLAPAARVRAAFHESGHVIGARDCGGVLFDFVEFVTDDADDGAPDGFYRVARVCYPASRHGHVDHAILSLCGIAAEAKFCRTPVASLPVLLDTGRSDLLAACQALERIPAARRPTLWSLYERAAS